jgi:hypothetical protein
MQRFAPVVVALFLAPAAVASTTANPPGLVLAQRACQAQGLTIGSDGYMHCLQQQLNGTKAPSSGSGSPSAQITVHKAQQLCAQQGHLPGSNGFMKCVNKTLTTAAQKTCVTKGLSQGSSSFARCVKQHLQAGTR